MPQQSEVYQQLCIEHKASPQTACRQHVTADHHLVGGKKKCICGSIAVVAVPTGCFPCTQSMYKLQNFTQYSYTLDYEQTAITYEEY